LGTRLSGMVQVLGTLLKAGALVMMIALPWLILRHVHAEYLQPMLPMRWTAAVWQGLLAAMVPVIWSYGGWDQLSHMAEEVRRPEKNIARAFGFGLACVAVLYAGAALAIHTAFPIAAVASSQAIGVDFFRGLLGSPGGVLITVVVMFSALTSAHVALMSGSRSCFAIARDGLFPARLALLHPRFGTPANAVIALTTWASLLVAANALWGGTRPLYLTLVTYVMFGLVLFGALICAAAIHLRRAHPEWNRPYRTWGYPFTPLASILISVFLLWAMLSTSPGESFAALAIILAGWPVYSRAARKLTYDANLVRI
jgi:APA family basic amino acid/polyamine antiporter